MKKRIVDRTHIRMLRIAYFICTPILLITLGIKFRGLRCVFLANPGLPLGGLLPTSKRAIYSALMNSGIRVPEYASPASLKEINNVTHEPIAVVKPDVGVQSKGIRVLWNSDIVSKKDRPSSALILQKFIGGCEYSTFVFRSASTVRIASLVAREFPHVIGDGKSTLRELITHSFADDDAVIVFLQNKSRLEWKPQACEIVQVAFLADSRISRIRALDPHNRPHLLKFCARVCDSLNINHARIDIKAANIESLTESNDITVLEVNGLYSVPIETYDPSYTLTASVKVLFTTIEHIFIAGCDNREIGLTLPSYAVIYNEIGRYICMSFHRRYQVFKYISYIFVLIVLDQITKVIAFKYLLSPIQWDFGSIQLVMERHVNTGAFLGAGQNLDVATRQILFVALNSFLSIGALLYSLRIDCKIPIPMLLVAAGGFSNVIDRVLFAGGVRDFLIFGLESIHTGVFNVADVYLTAAFFLIIFFRKNLEKPPARPRPSV